MKISYVYLKNLKKARDFFDLIDLITLLPAKTGLIQNLHIIYTILLLLEM